MQERKQIMARTNQTPKKQHKKYKFLVQGLRGIAKEMKCVDNCILKAAMAWYVNLYKLCNEVLNILNTFCIL